MINQLFLVKFDWLGEAKKTQVIPNSSVKFGICEYLLNGLR